jgi:GNAT superfamily N-acetyltransferase
MPILQLDLTDRRQRRAFLALPERLYAATPQWVPPLRSEAAAQLDPAKNPYFRHSQAAFFVYQADGRILGRLAVLDHRPYNNFNQARTAFFYLFECENDPRAAAALFAAAEDWARARGLEQVLGPKGFSPLDGLGLLVRGCQHRPALGIPYNPAYYADLLLANGYQGLGEVVSGYLPGDAHFPERIHEIAERVRERRGLRVARFEKRRDLQAIVPQLQDLYNLAIEGTPGNYPVEAADVQAIADQMLRFADPRLIKIVYKGEEIAGFLFAYPDISAALQRTGGRLFPLGWADLLREQRRTPWVNINGMGILPQYRGAGGTALLFSELYKSVSERGFAHAELVQIGAENDPMLRELRSLGVDFYKAHQLFAKTL